MKNRLVDLVDKSAFALLRQDLVAVTFDDGKRPDGFPLPTKREAPKQDGSVTQLYRPLAVLVYVNDVLSGALASRAAKGKGETT